MSHIQLESNKTSTDSIVVALNKNEMNDTILTTKCGYLYKRHDTVLSYFFPFLFSPWRKRYFRLIGQFLYRYTDETSDNIKGIPIPLDFATTIDIDEGDIFTITMIRKKYIIKAESNDDCNSWVKELKIHREIVIKESLGHKKVDEKYIEINKIGHKIFFEKLRKESLQHNTSYTTYNPLGI